MNKKELGELLKEVSNSLLDENSKEIEYLKEQVSQRTNIIATLLLLFISTNHEMNVCDVNLCLDKLLNYIDFTINNSHKLIPSDKFIDIFNQFINKVQINDRIEKYIKGEV